MKFNGTEYQTGADHARLSDQHRRIKSLMRDGRWRTLQEIADVTGDPVASVSAQLRHFRKERFGGHTVERQARGNRDKGLFEYRLILNGTKGEQMKISEIKYGRKFNLGNYESEEIVLTAVLDDGEDTAEVLSDLKQQVEDAHAGSSTSTANNPEPEETEDEDDADNDSAEADDDSDSTDDDDEAEDEDDDGDSDGDEDAGNDEDEKPPQRGKAGKGKSEKSESGKGKGGKKVKPKAEVYARTNSAHKDLFSSLLTEVDANWKKDEKKKAKAKKLSQDLEGEAFLDKDGEVLASFKQSVKKAMAKK